MHIKTNSHKHNIASHKYKFQTFVTNFRGKIRIEEEFQFSRITCWPSAIRVLISENVANAKCFIQQYTTDFFFRCGCVVKSRSHLKAVEIANLRTQAPLSSIINITAAPYF